MFKGRLVWLGIETNRHRMVNPEGPTTGLLGREPTKQQRTEWLIVLHKHAWCFQGTVRWHLCISSPRFITMEGKKASQLQEEHHPSFILLRKLPCAGKANWGGQQMQPGLTQEKPTAPGTGCRFQRKWLSLQTWHIHILQTACACSALKEELFWWTA